MSAGGSGEGSVSPARSQSRVSGNDLIRSDSEGHCVPSGRLTVYETANFSNFFDFDDDCDLLCEGLGVGLPLDGQSKREDGILLASHDSLQGQCDGQECRFVSDHSVSNELCQGRCDHELAGCEVQLNSCNFYRELYMNKTPDPMADYLYHGVIHGFDIVDPDCDATYCCANYSSIEAPEFKGQMDAIIRQELDSTKVTLNGVVPDSVHALGAIRKSSGKLRPITDCRRPLGLSINNRMATTFSPFRYVTIDEICDELEGNKFMAVVDIKSAYRSINISPGHRKYQGFKWSLEGKTNYYTDNCVCFGLRCVPYIFNQFTEFLVRAMHRRGFRTFLAILKFFCWLGRIRRNVGIC